MATGKLVLLSVLLVISPVLRVSTLESDMLQHWLNDPAALRGLMNAWRRGGSPLASAFAAFNASTSASTSTSTVISDTERYSIISVGCVLDVIKLLNARESWAFSMVDSSVKTPVGIFAGGRMHFGNWDECVDQRDIPSIYRSRTFNGQMCMLGIRAQVDSTSGSEPVSLAQSPLTVRKSPFVAPEISSVLQNLQVSMGVCVPDSCSAKDVQTLFKALLDNLKIVDGIKLVPSVSDGACTTRDAPGLDSDDMVAVMVLSILAALVVMSTVYDVVTPTEERRALPAAFSVISNGRKLLELPRANADHTLSCLHGLRFFSMCWVIIFHRFQAPLVLPNVNPSFAQYVYHDFFHMFFLNGSLCVDTFLVVSGLLLAYLFFKQDPSKQRLNIPMYYLHRYIRLTPVLAMMVLLSATILIRMGWGPLWSSFMTNNRILCQRNWWNTILYVSNYVRPSETCVDQAWYLMVDMQLHWLSPLILLPLARVPKIGIVWLISLCFAGTLQNFLVLYLQDKSGNGDHSGYVAYSLENFYGSTHTRFVPYLIGIATGYILSIRWKSDGEKKSLPLLISIAGWVIVAGLLLGAFLSYNIYLEPPEPSQLASSFYDSLMRPTWALGIALLVYLCAIGNGGAVNVFLSWWGFHILGRLSYSTYLVHVAWQRFQVAPLRTPMQLGDSELLAQFCSDLVVALLLGAILFLVCEAPFLLLEKELLGGKKSKKGQSNPGGALPSRSPAVQDSVPTAPESTERLNENEEIKTESASVDSKDNSTTL